MSVTIGVISYFFNCKLVTKSMFHIYGYIDDFTVGFMLGKMRECD